MGTAADNKLEKRNKILDSAYQLFMANSAASTAIDDVVKMAGVAKGTFYLYFKDKHDLLEQIIVYKSLNILKEAVAYTKEKNKDASLIEKIFCICGYLIEFFECHKDFTALFNKNYSYFFKFFYSGVNDEFNAILREFTDSFTKEGYSETDAKMSIYLIMEALCSVTCDSVLETGPYTMEEMKPFLKKTVENILEVKKNG